MKNKRVTNHIAIVLCVLAVAGLVAASVVCGMHAVGGEQCRCPVCCVFSVLGAVMPILAICAVAWQRAERCAVESTRAVHEAVPLHTVKFNC